MSEPDGAAIESYFDKTRMPSVLLGERSDRAVPRTSWSVHNKKELATWWRCRARLLADAISFQPERQRLILFGDSITESWRGTSYGSRIARAKGVPMVLNSTLAARWPAPLPLGISADQTQHLLWRMRNGEVSEPMKHDRQLIFVLLIGTNNLGRAMRVDETVRGITACAEYLLNATRGRLLVNAILPRGDRRKRGRNKHGRPTPNFLGDIVAVNAALRDTVGTRLTGTFPGRVSFVDCGAPFLVDPTSSWTVRDEKQEVVKRELMPDRLHPNAAGHMEWARCLEPALLRLSGGGGGGGGGGMTRP